MISIVTPVLNHSELIRTYEPTVKGAQVVIVDNGSDPHHAQAWKAMVDRLNGVYIRNEVNAQFAVANNQGYQATTGDIVVFLNNDVEAPPGWLDKVATDTGAGMMAGQSMGVKHGQRYIEGYCIAARRGVWDMVGLWPEHLPGMYWEDNIVCLLAARKGVILKVCPHWGVWHFGNYTSSTTPRAYDFSAANELYFMSLLGEGE